ncbi:MULTISPECIES: filament integrity protein FraC [Leptolyngbya]|uniref:Filament integrity protein n=1 Tax=Leptolyngbya boryana CZ1 TaxID=3060204 RepID=A0AA96X0W2_LEPBY|nr:MULTISPECIES: filament integrity protein FraC [Leptolyngbya]MCY6488600.1 hypothetical protein [Leptolyngbya sp. GGD]WNZ48786.1 hypothetical protein Q2T42_13225 [Leptolyngbya boryana CZ1]
MWDVLPLRAILYQLLFIVLAIAVEALVLQKYLGIGKKSSIQYAATANLLSTVAGWFLFFVIEPWLPPTWRQQLINYIFFDLTSTPPVLIGLAFLTFLGTFVVKLQSLDWLDLILENKKPVEIEVRDRTKFQGRKAQRQAFSEIPNRALAVLWANAASFSAITLIIAIRTFSEPPSNF